MQQTALRVATDARRYPPREDVMKDIVWTDYMKYRSSRREIDLSIIEHIVRHTGERYVDSETHRLLSEGTSTGSSSSPMRNRRLL